MISPSKTPSIPNRWHIQWRTLGPLLLLLAVNLFLISPLFCPSLSDLNPWDEAAHINKGRMLVDHGEWPIFAQNPLVGAFYALTYLPFRASPFWLVQSASLGRVFLFILIWTSACLVAWALRRHLPPLWMAGMLLVTPLAADMLHFPSDPLFAALAGLSFWQLLTFHNEHHTRHLWLSSAFLGLASMARNDGLVLFPILIFLSQVLIARKTPWRQRVYALLASSLPFLLLVGGYVLFYGLRSGTYSLGTMERTYTNFEAGQEAVYQGSGDLSSVTTARLEAQRVFGTYEENDGSVFNAIQRNPAAYGQRLLAVTQSLPYKLLDAYGIRFAPLLFLLALYGIVTLARQKQFALLLLLGLWPMHLASGFLITLFRPGHLQFPYYIVFALALIGLGALCSRLEQPLTAATRLELTIFLAALAGLAIFGWLANKLAIYYGAVLFLAALLLLLALRRWVDPPIFPSLALFVLLCAGLLIHGDFPSPTRRLLGADPREQAVLYLAENFPTDTRIAAASAAPVWMARMSFLNLTSPDVPTDRTPQAFLEWARLEGIELIYVDELLSSRNEKLWELIEPQIGFGLERLYSAQDGDIQVLRLSQP
ncbi:MAG: hypothetical protein JW726_18610 [Anaerolineales bacterium]|nr:hypothetical protein [Anaerolineales bacterium]